MSQQRTVNLQSSDSEDNVEEKRETSAFFFQYIARRAESDQDLSVGDADIIEQQKEEAVKAVSDAAATKVASKLADLGKSLCLKGIGRKDCLGFSVGRFSVGISVNGGKLGESMWRHQVRMRLAGSTCGSATR